MIDLGPHELDEGTLYCTKCGTHAFQLYKGPRFCVEAVNVVAISHKVRRK
jgi:Zn finger protein HypA/HybF involved in hydrogenase expression